MKKYLCLFLLPFFCILRTEAGTSLQEAFKSALEKNETPKLQKSKTNQLEESVEQGKGGLYPKIYANANYTRMDPGEGKTLDNSHAIKLNATQPLFHGLKEFYAIDASKFELESQKELEEFYRLNLLGQVAQYYYSILSYQADLRNLNEQLGLTNSRIGELKERVRIGKSRRSDLLSSEAQKASLQAQIDSTKTQLELSRKYFTNLTELPESFSLNEIQESPLSLSEQETYLRRIEDRPDIKAAQKQVASTHEQIRYAKAGHLPSVDLVGNYYVDRSGTPKPSQWDVGASITLPLYEGGVTSSQVRLAVEKQNEKSLLLSQTRRAAEKDILNSYQNLKGNLSQLEFYKESIKSSKAAYEEYQKDYRFGLSSLLDVIQAQNNLLDAKKNYDRLRYQTQLSWIQLKIATADEDLRQ